MEIPDIPDNFEYDSSDELIEDPVYLHIESKKALSNRLEEDEDLRTKYIERQTERYATYKNKQEYVSNPDPSFAEAEELIKQTYKYMEDSSESHDAEELIRQIRECTDIENLETLDDFETLENIDDFETFENIEPLTKTIIIHNHGNLTINYNC